MPGRLDGAALRDPLVPTAAGRLPRRRSALSLFAPRPRLALAEPTGRDAILGCHDYGGFAERLLRLRERAGLTVRRLGMSDGGPLDVIRLSTARSGRRALRVLLSAGVHGIEPSGPGAALLAVSRLLAAPERYPDVELTVLPLVNPAGYRAQRRGNGDGLDLNRHFVDDDEVPHEVLLSRAVLAGGPFDLGIDLHASRSVGERGFFALHREATAVLVPAMRNFGERYPILRESTGRYILESPGVLRSENRGTVKDYLADKGTRWSMTIEAPAVWPYERQVEGNAEIVLKLIEAAQQIAG